MAWPTKRGTSGRRAFFIDQAGDVLQTENLILPYTGATYIPMACAVRKLNDKIDPRMSATLAANSVGLDGRTWTIVD